MSSHAVKINQLTTHLQVVLYLQYLQFLVSLCILVSTLHLSAEIKTISFFLFPGICIIYLKIGNAVHHLTLSAVKVHFKYKIVIVLVQLEL